MAGIRGISPLKLIHQKIEKTLHFNRIYIVNYHTRTHIFGSLHADTKGKCYIDKHIDPVKLVASLIKYPRNCKHEETHSGVQSVSYENEFTSTIGTSQESDADERGHIIFIKIAEEHHPEFREQFDYYLVTLIISENWRISCLDGPQCQRKPNQPAINYRSIFRELGDTHP